jgi:hypothetical protein
MRNKDYKGLQEFLEYEQRRESEGGDPSAQK